MPLHPPRFGSKEVLYSMPVESDQWLGINFPVKSIFIKYYGTTDRFAIVASSHSEYDSDHENGHVWISNEYAEELSIVFAAIAKRHNERIDE